MIPGRRPALPFVSNITAIDISPGATLLPGHPSIDIETRTPGTWASWILYDISTIRSRADWDAHPSNHKDARKCRQALKRDICGRADIVPPIHIHTLGRWHHFERLEATSLTKLWPLTMTTSLAGSAGKKPARREPCVNKTDINLGGLRNPFCSTRRAESYHESGGNSETSTPWPVRPRNPFNAPYKYIQT